eukprot:gene3908-2776_t
MFASVYFMGDSGNNFILLLRTKRKKKNKNNSITINNRIFLRIIKNLFNSYLFIYLFMVKRNPYEKNNTELLIDKSIRKENSVAVLRAEERKNSPLLEPINNEKKKSKILGEVANARASVFFFSPRMKQASSISHLSLFSFEWQPLPPRRWGAERIERQDMEGEALYFLNECFSACRADLKRGRAFCEEDEPETHPMGQGSVLGPLLFAVFIGRTAFVPETMY